MNNLQLDEFLELIAKLVEAKAKDVAEAAKIIRDAKVTHDTKKADN